MLRLNSNLNNRSFQRTSTLFSRMENRVVFGPNYMVVENTITSNGKNEEASESAKRWLAIEKYASILAGVLVVGIAYYLSGYFGLFGN